MIPWYIQPRRTIPYSKGKFRARREGSQFILRPSVLLSQTPQLLLSHLIRSCIPSAWHPQRIGIVQPRSILVEQFGKHLCRWCPGPEANLSQLCDASHRPSTHLCIHNAESQITPKPPCSVDLRLQNHAVRGLARWI